MIYHFLHTAYRLPYATYGSSFQKFLFGNKALRLLFAVCLLFPACNYDTFYHKTNTLSHETWNMDSILVYKFSIPDSLQYFNFYIDVRNTTDYPYQNLYLFFTTQFPNGSVFTDTLNCILSDAYGRWKGKGSGRIKENRFVFKSKVRFPQTGVYLFSVQQAMQDIELKGITNFGITLQHE